MQSLLNRLGRSGAAAFMAFALAAIAQGAFCVAVGAPAPITAAVIVQA
jgi:hypothetical protein